MARSVEERIEAFNQGRESERLALKLQALERSAFTFLRGTCHLFYADLPAHPLLQDAPATWVCGDLHLENFGTYQGDNRAVYFDLNDFDEAALAPCSWEVVRLLASSMWRRRNWAGPMPMPWQLPVLVPTARLWLQARHAGSTGMGPMA